MVKPNPAAWRVRRGENKVWSYADNEQEARFHGSYGGMRYDAEPLYHEDAIAQARAEGYAAGLEAAAKAVGMEDREGRDWIPKSLWGKLTSEAQARVRALSPPSGKEGNP